MREFEYPVLDCEAIGGRIREERVRRSFTIQEVCDALSVSPQAVGKWQWESGSVESPCRALTIWLPCVPCLMYRWKASCSERTGCLFDGLCRLSGSVSADSQHDRKVLPGNGRRDYEILPINSTNPTLSRIIWYFLFKKQPHMKSALLLNYA